MLWLTDWLWLMEGMKRESGRMGLLPFHELALMELRDMMRRIR
jgi:hypothetical protein